MKTWVLYMQPPERRRMDDTVAVALMHGERVGDLRLRVKRRPRLAAGLAGVGRKGRKAGLAGTRTS